jgi:NAD(P)H-dependent flavin oxidoreductase YrpB (nitropropane dioxygenase family)
VVILVNCVAFFLPRIYLTMGVGDIPSSILIPACVDAVRGHRSPLTGQPVLVVGAGGVLDGRSLAANLMWGASGVWVRAFLWYFYDRADLDKVGTRFVASTEAAAPKRHKEMLVSAGVDDAVTTLIYSGRPLRLRRNEYVDDW